MSEGPPAGWYPDPTRRNEHRYWDGRAWTAIAGRDGHQVVDPMPPGLPSDQRAELAYARTYLEGAAARGVIAPDALARLLADVAWWQGAPIFGPPEASRCIERAAPLPAPPVVTAPPATVAPPPVVLPSPPVVLPPPPVGAPRPVATGPGWAPPSTTVSPEAAPPEPGRISRLVKAVSSELAIHGLADLGVLLVFAGLFGFVAFAFGEVRVGLRPVAELAIPATFGGTGWFVRRRGTPLIGAALVFLGGALLPVVVIASTSDGAPFPPDLTGSMLVVGLTAALVLIAVGYVVVALRDPTTPLRFLAAPVLWLAVAVAGLGLGRAVPEGSALASPAALQWSLVCAAIALSVLAARLVLPERWVAPVVVPAWAGLPVAYVLTLLAAHESGWSAPAVVVAGVAAIVGLELLAAGWRLDLVTGLQVTVLVVTAWEVSDQWGVGWAALAAGTVALAAAELRTRQRAPAAVAEALVWGSALALGLTVVDVTATPWALVVGSAGAWCWALVRTHRPAVVSPTVTTALLWALPVGAALGLATATDVGTAQVVLAAALVVIAAGIRVRPAGVLPLWDRWVPAAGAALLVWVVDQAAATVPIEPTASAIAAAALATAALALAPRWPTVRLWTAASGVAVTGAMVALRVDARPDQAALVLVGVGVVAAVAAEVRRARLWGHVGLIGQLSALVAVGVAVSDLPEEVSRTPARLAVVVAGCWAAFAVSAVVEEARGSSVADLLARSWVLVQTGFDADAAIAPQPSGPERAVRLAPLVVAVALAPLALVAALDAGGIPAVGSPWIPVAPVGLLALGGVLARLLEPARRPAAAVLAVEGTVLASLGVLAVDPDGWPVVVALALLIGLVVVVGPRLRRGFMVWIAVVASDLLVGATADVLGVDDAHVYLVPLVWGGLLVVASLAWDRRSSEAERSARWRRPALLAPFAIGMATLVLGWLAGLGEGASAASWSSLIAAGFLAVASVQLGTAWLTTASWLLITVTAGHLSPRDPLEQPWVYVPWTAALLVAAEALHRWAPARTTRWRDRWSVPPLASAGVVALVALAVSLDVGWVSATWCGLGGLALLVAARVRWAPLGLVGTFVVLVGAGAAGPGWLALAFAATTVGSVLIAVRVVGPWRTVLQVMASSAVVGAWASLGTWASWTPQEWVIATAAAAVFGSLALGLVIRFAGLARDWTLVVVAPIALALAGLPLLLGDPSVDQAIAGLWAAAAFGAAALAAGGCARPTGLPWLREVSAVIALLAGALVLDAVGADVGTVVISCGVAVVLLTAALVLLGAVRPGSVWSRPIEIAAVGALVGTWVGLASDEIALVEVALLLTGAELVALGVTRRRPLLVELAPSAFCAAWIAYALDALGGDPGWFAAPVGLTVLATVSLARRQRRSEGLAPATDLLSALEIIGMVLLVIAPLVRTISVALAYAALAIALGLALGVWGIATRVRQRLAGGAVTVVAAVALLLLVPIVDSGNARRATGPWLWLAVALVGLIAIVAAALLERGRRAIHQTTARLQELTRDWE